MRWLSSSACDANHCVEVAFDASGAGGRVAAVNDGEWTRACETAQCVEVQWRKSSASGPGGQCVEVGTWKKSSASGPNDDMCVEVAGGPDLSEILVRDSKDHGAGPVLRFSRAEWLAFLGKPGVSGAKGGEFDLP